MFSFRDIKVRKLKLSKEKTQKISLFLPQGMRQCRSKREGRAKWRVNELRGRKGAKESNIKARAYIRLYYNLSFWLNLFAILFANTSLLLHLLATTHDCLCKEMRSNWLDTFWSVVCETNSGVEKKSHEFLIFMSILGESLLKAFDRKTYSSHYVSGSNFSLLSIPYLPWCRWIGREILRDVKHYNINIY